MVAGMYTCERLQVVVNSVQSCLPRLTTGAVPSIINLVQPFTQKGITPFRSTCPCHHTVHIRIRGLRIYSSLQVCCWSISKFKISMGLMDKYAVALRRINHRRRVGHSLLVTAKSWHKAWYTPCYFRLLLDVETTKIAWCERTEDDRRSLLLIYRYPTN